MVEKFTSLSRKVSITPRKEVLQNPPTSAISSIIHPQTEAACQTSFSRLLGPRPCPSPYREDERERGGREGEGALYANSPEDVNIGCRVIDSLHEERKK